MAPGNLRGYIYTCDNDRCPVTRVTVEAIGRVYANAPRCPGSSVMDPGGHHLLTPIAIAGRDEGKGVGGTDFTPVVQG